MLFLAAGLGGVATGAVAKGPPADSAAAEEEFDHLDGIDPNGRIPAAQLPADLHHPERWRYIPEGRLKPGNLFQRLLVSSFIFPLVFRDSDVGTGFGLGITDIDFRTQRRREFAGAFGSYTTEGQRSVFLVWQRWLNHIELPAGGVLREERSLVGAEGGYSKTLTRRFFGLGANSTEADESSYTDTLFELQLGMQRSLPEPGDNLVVNVVARGEFHALDDGKVSGAPSTADAYPLAFGTAKDQGMGWLGVGVRWDTRDSQLNPYQGWTVGAFANGALAQSGGDLGGVFSLRSSKVFRLPGLFHRGALGDEANPPTDTLVFALETQASAGDLPFFSLPTLGGSYRLRGYIDGRFRDRASWFAGAEYRLWVLSRGIPITRTIRVERLGLALFGEAGSVASDWPSLFESRVRFSYGVGLRISLERAAPFRVDFGFSPEGLNWIARFGLSF